jgi:methyl-accepting chemotaxis protein
VKGFFQLLGESGTPEILLMGWRVMQGMEQSSTLTRENQERMEDMAALAEETSASTEEIASASAELAQMAERLKKMMEHFKLR